MPATVLVVDDDPDIREALCAVLRDEGFVVCEAGNGVEALERIARKEPDLVLLDLMMPIMSGWEVLGALRARPRPIRVVVLTAQRGVDCDDLVEKPVSLERLLAIVDQVRTLSMGKIVARS